MNDFRLPNVRIDNIEIGGELLKSQPASGPRKPRFFLLRRNNQTIPDPGDRLGMSPYVQADAAQIVAHEWMPGRRIPRLWNAAMRCVPSPFGSAMRPLFEPTVVKHLPIVRNTPTIKQAAGKANPFGAGGSTEPIRIPAASTLGAF